MFESIVQFFADDMFWIAAVISISAPLALLFYWKKKGVIWSRWRMRMPHWIIHVGHHLHRPELKWLLFMCVIHTRETMIENSCLFFTHDFFWVSAVLFIGAPLAILIYWKKKKVIWSSWRPSVHWHTQIWSGGQSSRHRAAEIHLNQAKKELGND